MIVGCGPAGLFCAYVLAQVGQDVTVVERGQPIEQRVLDVDNFEQLQYQIDDDVQNQPFVY